MSRATTLPVLIAGLMFLATVAAFAPPAAAQGSTQAPATVSMKITPLTDPVQPLSGLGIMKIDVNYQYFAPASAVPSPTAVHLKVTDQPPWAVISISPSTIFFPIQPGTSPGTTVTDSPISVNVLITTTADAPAFTAAPLKISATADPNTGVIAGSTADDQTQIQAGFFSIIDAQVAEPVKIERPQSAVTIPITLTNFGNANTKVTFSIVEKSGNLQIVVPQPLTMESKQTGGKLYQQVVAFTVQTPYHNGYLNEPATVQLGLSSVYALDPTKKGDTTQVSVLVTTKGFYVPGFDPTLLVFGLVGVAAILGRRKNR
ncbi:MAG: hypothetical protein ACYDCK_02760 [Thermoplasmatota archaeon]